MTGKEKKVVFTLIGIMVIILVVVVCVNTFGKGGKDKDNDNTVANNNQSNVTQNEENTEKYVTQLENGTKLNNSTDLKTPKTYKTVEISNIQVTSNNGNSAIIADVKNTGSTTFEGETVKLTLLGENGEVIAELSPVLPKVEPGQTEQLNAIVTADIANIKDFKVEAK